MKLCVFLALFFLTFFHQPAFSSTTSATIPLDSWVYPALDKLDALGLIQSSLQANRPYSRLEAARQTIEAARNINRADHPLPVAYQLLRRLNAELHQQLVELGNVDGRSASTYLKPIGDWEGHYTYREGFSSPVAANTIAAEQFLLNYNNFGIDYAEGENVQLIAETEVRFNDFFLINLRPLALFRDEPGYGESASSLTLLQGTAALGLGPFELSCGRQSLWWGQGHHGTLALTNNAEPLDMIRLTTPSPILLPWLFKRLGPFRFDYFLTRLEEERVVPEPYFTGINLAFKPRPWLEVGMRRMIIYGGEGMPSQSLDDYLSMLAGDHPIQDNSNSIVVFDTRVKIPALWGLELYTEIGAEDLSNPPFGLADEAILAGLHLPRIEPTGRASLRFEFTDLTESDDHILRWYVHRIYRSGYTYNNQILGHFAGTDARDYYVEMQVVFPSDITLKTGYTFQLRGISNIIQEEHRQLSLGLEWGVSQSLHLLLSYAYDQVDNFNFQPGNDPDFYLAQAAIRGRW